VETRDLKLVSADRGEAARSRGGAPLALAALVLTAVVTATLGGADAARRKIEVRELAENALQMALDRGSADPEVQATLADLRGTLGWRPLESKTRVIYASLVLGLASSLDDMRLASFHAGRAAELSPVTVPVVRAATLVLANTGEIDRALELIRRMFGYDAGSAAETLGQVESLVLGVRLTAGIPDDVDAWMAWARWLRDDGRRDEADDWLRRAHERWPGHLSVRVQLASRAFARRDWGTLEALLPIDGPLPDERAAGRLHVLRGHLKLQRGDGPGATADAETALRLDPSAGMRLLAGDLFHESGDPDRARAEWNRSLHATAREQGSTRRALLVRLGRLEDRYGRPAAALRHWQAVLELDPQHPEARRRVDDLSGFNR